MCYHLIDKSFHGMWPGQQTKRNTTLNDTGRVKYLQGYIGALLNAVRNGSNAKGSLEFSRYDFPTDFIFGAGTSAYQVEGAAFQDGRTPSTWDTFAHAGHAHGATGDIACDEYHKYKEDVKLMVETGLDAYRFSISWSRLIPNGRGAVNPKGLEYYNNLINELIKHGCRGFSIRNEVNIAWLAFWKCFSSLWKQITKIIFSVKIKRKHFQIAIRAMHSNSPFSW
ncbi:hypothetical protein VitviT2T_009494 [Vitis vinifera]|uniref:Uncharacterized protein n=1 Tax=Vitis vinifera TaxID=29760 RepID=A0ABY9C504_VITVI|nr:hypothetical protein VitviT2T_009494 [Vitis vinifera]